VLEVSGFSKAVQRPSVVVGLGAALRQVKSPPSGDTPRKSCRRSADRRPRHRVKLISARSTRRIRVWSVAQTKGGQVGLGAVGARSVMDAHRGYTHVKDISLNLAQFERCDPCFALGLVGRRKGTGAGQAE